MRADPAGRRSGYGPARGVAAVRRPGTIYTTRTATQTATRPPGPVRGQPRRSVWAMATAAAAGMVTVMVGGGLLLGQVVVVWLGV